MGHLEKRIIIGALGLVAMFLAAVVSKGLPLPGQEVLYIPPAELPSKDATDEQGDPAWGPIIIVADGYCWPVSDSEKIHTVVGGDTLTAIAGTYYPGQYEYIEKIAIENKTLFTRGKNTVLRIGWRLCLPE